MHNAQNIGEQSSLLDIHAHINNLGVIEKFQRGGEYLNGLVVHWLNEGDISRVLKALNIRDNVRNVLLDQANIQEIIRQYLEKYPDPTSIIRIRIIGNYQGNGKVVITAQGNHWIYVDIIITNQFDGNGRLVHIAVKDSLKMEVKYIYEIKQMLREAVQSSEHFTAVIRDENIKYTQVGNANGYLCGYIALQQAVMSLGTPDHKLYPILGKLNNDLRDNIFRIILSTALASNQVVPQVSASASSVGQPKPLNLYSHTNIEEKIAMLDSQKHVQPQNQMSSATPAASVANSPFALFAKNVPKSQSDCNGEICTPPTFKNMDTGGLTYEMDHLLQAGFLGTEYQLLVFLARLTGLLSDPNISDFSAVVEPKGFGNLDDIGVKLKNCGGQVIRLESYQVKHYDKPIFIKYFYNNSDVTEESNKNAKMHIGKFLDGWLSWKKKYPTLVSGETLTSVLYSNAGLDDALSSLIKNGTFRLEFREHSKVFSFDDIDDIYCRFYDEAWKYLNKASKICKNFLEKLECGKIYSVQIFDKLLKGGFIDSDGCLTSKFLPNNPKFKLTLDLTNSKAKKTITNKQLLKILKDLYIPELQYDDVDKHKCFREFLSSFRFCTQQPDISQQEKRIIENLYSFPKLSSYPADLLFLGLHYGVIEWFGGDLKKHTKLTKGNLLELLSDISVRYHDIVVLQERSKITLEDISYQCGCESVEREEISQLYNGLKTKKFLMVKGRKGLGKSGLVKKILENQYPRHSCLFLSATDIVHDVDLRKIVLKVLSSSTRTIEILVLDGAESLLCLDDHSSKELFDVLRSVQNTKIVLTITEEASLNPIFASNQIEWTSIAVKKLSLENVLHVFPELNQYSDVKPIMKFAKIPFYLSMIIELVKNQVTQQLNYVSINEHELVKLVVQGFDKEKHSSRLRLWMRLSSGTINQIDGFDKEISYKSAIEELSLLEKDKIILRRDGVCNFRHDLLFEHGVMELWYRQWETAFVINESRGFWKKCNGFLSDYGLRVIFKKWLFLYFDQVMLDLKEAAERPSSDFLGLIAVVAIERNNNQFLEWCLEEKTLDTNAILTDWSSYLPIPTSNYRTYVFLAIWFNNPKALQMLLDAGASIFWPQSIEKQLALSDSEISEEELSGDSEIDKSSVSEDHDSDGESEAGYSNNDDDDDDNSSSVSEEELSGDSDSDKSHGSEDSEECSDDGESEEGYSYYDSDDEDNSSSALEQEEYDPAEDFLNKFICNPQKYWSKNFVEGIFEYDDNDCEVPVEPDDPPVYQDYIQQVVINNKKVALKFYCELYKNGNTKGNVKGNANFVGAYRNNYEETLLHIAAQYNAFEAMECLLSYAADSDVNLQDCFLETPLHNAVYQGNTKISELLLKYNANPNKTNHYFSDLQLSPLHVAIARLDLPMVQLLFEYGADLSLRADLDGGVSVEDILKIKFSDYSSTEDKVVVTKFILDLIKLLNYGCENNGNFNWGCKCSEYPHFELKNKQLVQADILIQLLKSCIHAPKEFWKLGALCDYDDEATELIELVDAIENQDVKKLDELIEYIFNDKNKVNYVFGDNNSQLIKLWMNSSNKLKVYVQTIGNKDFIGLIGQYECSDSNSDESEEYDLTYDF